MALSKAALAAKKAYEKDPAQRAQVDSLVKVSKKNYGRRLTKDEVFTIQGDHKGDIEGYIAQKGKKKSPAKPATKKK